MLTRSMGISTIEQASIIPDRLTRVTHSQYLAYADRMSQIYEQGIGRTRKSLHRDVQALLGEITDCPPRRAQAFCKLLDEASTFHCDRRGEASKLRREIFRMAAPFHPLVERPEALWENREQKIKSILSARWNAPWSEIKHRLFRDLIEFHELVQFRGFPQPADLLSRYNVAQAQVVLFDATEMTIQARDDFKSILRYAKLAKLMHRIRKTADGYEFVLDGPASILRRTHRYGIQMAKFLPGLLSCREWSFTALIRQRNWSRSLRFDLNCQSGLSSSVATPSEFDSQIEREFADKWNASTETKSWRLSRETEILHDGQMAYMPDFVFLHEDGRRILLEIIGFWTPEYLAHKQQVLERFCTIPMLLAVSSQQRPAFQSRRLHRIVEYKKSLSVDQVLKCLQQFDN